MPRHDSIFKALLRSFFADLLWLVVPELAARLDLQHPVFLDKEFLVDCVEAYLELNSDERAEYAQLSKVRENREVRTMATTWSERIAAQGREEGLQAGQRMGLQAGRQEGLQEGLQAVRKILLVLLEQRFGPLSDTTRERVEAINSFSRLTRLSERVLTARSLAALRLH